ncbi:MAG: hypothetical protein CL834_05075, partial [Crocinitomicaceae bacterium]|nr:hypothetical protein [Crocinitomicaceae bacterium]
ASLSNNGNAATNLVFYWGDNDGETSPTSWDSNFTIANAQVGTLRKSLTGLTGGNTYYFRTFASNWKGNAWASTTRSFTTVTSTVRDNPVRNSDLKGWWKLDGNLQDSSGNHHHGDATFIWKPSELSGLKLWLDSSKLSTAASTWEDVSGNGNSATKGGSPSVVTNAQNGLSVMHYTGNGQRHKFNMINDIRTVFWVLSIDQAYSSSGYRYVLGDSTKHPHWHNNNNGKLFGGLSNTHVQNASTRLNGASVNGNTTNQPTSLSILSVKTTGNVDADQFGYDRTITSRQWIGKLGELIIYNSALSDGDIAKVEGQLAHKWGLAGSLPSAHPYKSAVPFRGSNPFSTETAFGNGQSMDLSNGVFASISTGGTEDLFDGDSNFSTSVWVKGWPSEANQSILSKAGFEPGSMGNLMTWLDASESKYLTTTEGTFSPPSDGNDIASWFDKSGNGFDAIPNSSGTAQTWQSSSLNSKPTVSFSGTNSNMKIKDSETKFDGWNKLHVFAVFQVNGNPNWSRIFGKTTDASQGSNTAWHYATRRGDYDPPLYFSSATNGAGTNYWRQKANSYTASLKDNPGLFSLSFGDGSFTTRVDGTEIDTISSTGSLKSLSSEPVRLGQNMSMKVSEFIIFQDKLSTANEQRVEGYLAHKWGLQGELPNGHNHKASTPDFGGWAIERGPSGADDITLNLVGAGDKFTQSVPMNDDQWHHLATTFGGGNKRIYVDGAEVTTASQSGSVTDSINRIILGDTDISTNSKRPKVDDLRFYRGILSAAEVSAIYNHGVGDVGIPKFSISSPSDILGTKGKSVSYQIIADPAYGLSGYNSSITYSLLNAPSWLSVGSSSGIVTGTPTATGSFTFDVKAVNTLGSNVKTVTLAVSDYSQWKYALSITTDFSENTPLSDWNMLVRLSETDSNGTGNRGFRYAQARSNGGDLRFINKFGSELKYEIAKWNPAGESHIWVRLPTLKSDENVTMYWGNPSAGLPTYANDGSVWKDYFGVYHLEDASIPGKDSSPRINHLTVTNSPVKVSNGLAGSAYKTDGSENGFISSNLSGGTKAKEGTYNIWATTGTDAADWKDWFNLSYDNTESEVLRLTTDASSSPKAKAFFKRSPATWQLSDTNDNAGNGNWQMLTFTLQKGYASIFIDGVLDGTTKFYFPGKNIITGLSLGRGFGNNSGPNTTVDEASFSSVGRSSNWISATYQNQKPNSGYLNFGNLIGPISLNDPTGTEVYGKKDSTLSHTIGFSGNGSFSASGLPPGLSINSSTGVISGSTSVVGTQSFTVTATGTTAGGAGISVSKQYKTVISDPSSFPFRVNLTLSGYTGTSTLPDFPVLVSMGSSISGFSYNAFLDSDGDGIRTGGDLRFFAANGKELSYELADWNSSGSSQVWVKVPSISGNNTLITAAWGKAGTETTTPDYATHDSVWSNGFHGVWHLNKMVSNSLSDSSPNGFHATAFNGAALGSAQVGRGIVLDGTDDYVNLGREAGNPGSVVGTSFWVKSSGTRSRILSNKETGSGNKGWEIFAASSLTNLNFYGSGSQQRNKNSVSDWSASNWHHVNAGFHADGTLSLQVDGTNKTFSSTQTVESVVSSTYDLLLGNAAHTSDEWNGAFDEVRISNVVRSTDWAKAEYDNQKSSQTFVTYGNITGPRIITSSLTASATVGSSFSYNITASTTGGAPSSYAAIDLPAGLSFTASSGAISGSPTLAGSFSIPLVVTFANDDGNLTDLDSNNDQLGALFAPVNAGDPDQILLKLDVQALPPSVATLAATSISATQATLEGNVISSGGDAPAITIYYGTSDGANNAATWSNSIDLGQLGAGTFSYPLGDLSPSTTYYYRIRAVNSAAPVGTWASTSKSFATPASTTPVVANGAVINASGTQATLQGRVISPGNGTINQGSANFSANRYDSLMLWLDADDTTTLDQGFAKGETGTPSNTNSVGFWEDKSGKGYHAIASRKLSDRRPSYQATGLNSKPTIQFDGTTDVMVVNGSESAFDAWDEMSIFLVFQGVNLGSWDQIIRKRITTGGWTFTHGSSQRAYFYAYGTSAAEGQWSDHNGNWNNSQIVTLQFGKGTRKWYFDGIADKTVNDLGSIESSIGAPVVLGGTVEQNGNDISEAPIKMSEVLIFRKRLALPDQQKVEGFLAHKWGLTGSMASSHPHKNSAPTFSDPISAVDLTLYWGPNDGGTNSAIWENNVSLGRFYAEQKVDGFSAKAYEIPTSLDKTQAATDYFADINRLLTLTPSGTAVIQGEPGNPSANGMDFSGDADFRHYEMGINVGTDRFMLLLETDFFAPSSGSYTFRSDINQDKSMLWIDLDQNGKYERIGNAGTERLTSSSLPGDITFDSVTLTAGQSYRMAFILAGIGGAHNWEIKYQVPGGSLTRIKPLATAQDGLFTTTQLANQAIGARQTKLEANVTGLVAGNSYYYRIKGSNSASDWADATGTFVAESALSQSAGTLTFDTDGSTPSWSSSDGRSGTGQIITTTYLDSQSNSISYNTAKFDFNSLSIGDGVQVHLLGSNPLHLQVSGDASISATLDLNGTNALDTATANANEPFDTLGRIGGGIGGKNISGGNLGAPGGGPAHLTNPNQFNSGGKPFPGHNDYRASGLVAGNGSGGGSYGGIGGRPEPTGGIGYNNTTIPPSGKTYGVPELTHLLAGSGGGGGARRAGGSGAGAIKIVSTGTLTIGGDVWAVGGLGAKYYNTSQTAVGGSGSGGAIYLKASNLVIQSGVKISADGGNGTSGISAGDSYSSDGGGSGAAAGGGGRIYIEASQSLVNHASATHSNLTASGGQSAGTRHGTDGTVKIIRPQVSSLVFTSGTLTIDTDNAEINHSDGSFLTGSLEDKSVTLLDGSAVNFKVCVFTADSISIGSGVVVNLIGRNALSLRTRNNGNLTLGTQLIANGGNAPDGTNPGIGKLGGFDGGMEDKSGEGPGGGRTKYDAERGGSAGYGGDGFSDGDATKGKSYGNAALSHLLGGSGGGGGNNDPGGAGGGAIELIAHGDGALSLSTSAKISVNGGDAYRDHSKGGGAGAGGAIRLQGGSISCLGTLEAKSLPSFALHAGGGGRISIQTNGNLLLGSVDLSGYRPGT